LKASKKLTALLRKPTHSFFEFHELLPTRFKIGALKLVLCHQKRSNVCIQMDRKCFVPNILAKLHGVNPEVLEGRLRVEFTGERRIDCGGHGGNFS
jgi:hypothetical protein